MIRKLTVQARLSADEASRIVRAVMAFPSVTADSGLRDAQEGFALASQLGQSDAFDATAYVIARRYGAEFWVSDRRFANAAAAARLPGVRFIG